MDASQVDAGVCSLHRIARRTALRGAAGAGLAALIARFAPEGVVARRKKRKRRKKRRKGQASRCADLCPGASFCFNRVAGPPLCGSSLTRGECVECTADQDCVDSAGPGGGYDPYCLTSLTQASDNTTAPFDCGAGAVVGVCTTVVKFG